MAESLGSSTCAQPCTSLPVVRNAHADRAAARESARPRMALTATLPAMLDSRRIQRQPRAWLEVWESALALNPVLLCWSFETHMLTELRRWSQRNDGANCNVTRNAGFTVNSATATGMAGGLEASLASSHVLLSRTFEPNMLMASAALEVSEITEDADCNIACADGLSARFVTAMCTCLGGA